MHETVATMTCCGADATPNSYYNSVLDDRPPTRFLISVTRRVHDVFWTRSRTSEVIRKLGSRRKTTLCARQHGAVQYVMFNSLLTVAISVPSWKTVDTNAREECVSTTTVPTAAVVLGKHPYVVCYENRLNRNQCVENTCGTRPSDPLARGVENV